MYISCFMYICNAKASLFSTYFDSVNSLFIAFKIYKYDMNETQRIEGYEPALLRFLRFVSPAAKSRYD